jgi:hypothetical protein
MLAPLMLPEWQFELLEHRLEFLRARGKLVSAVAALSVLTSHGLSACDKQLWFHFRACHTALLFGAVACAHLHSVLSSHAAESSPWHGFLLPEPAL